MKKFRDSSAGKKLGILKKYQVLPQMTQRQAACKLNSSQSLMDRMLKKQQEIENASMPIAFCLNSVNGLLFLVGFQFEFYKQRSFENYFYRV